MEHIKNAIYKIAIREGWPLKVLEYTGNIYEPPDVIVKHPSKGEIECFETFDDAKKWLNKKVHQLQANDIVIHNDMKNGGSRLGAGRGMYMYPVNDSENTIWVDFDGKGMTKVLVSCIHINYQVDVGDERNYISIKCKI